MKRGMLPFRPQAIALRLSDVLVKAKLPAIPAHFGHVGAAQPPCKGGWGMAGNSRAGDCVVAGGAHETQVFCWATGKPIPTFSDKTALANYSRCLVATGGSAYDPNDPSTDTGLDPVQAAQWRQAVGITDDSGAVHKIASYVSIKGVEEMQIAMYYGGAAAIAWGLPDSAETQFDAGEIWDDLSGEPTGGHYTSGVGINSKLMPFTVTWGALQGFTWDYFDKWSDGGISYLSHDYILATGKSPEGIDWGILQEYMKQLGSRS